MLTEADRELITAAVDGELAAADREAFAALLGRSPAAAVLFADLQADRDRLRAMRKLAAPAGLAAAVMAKIPGRKAEPARPTPKRSYLIAASIAAAFMVAVGLVAYFSASPTGERTPIAKQKPPAPNGDVTPPAVEQPDVPSPAPPAVPPHVVAKNESANEPAPQPVPSVTPIPPPVLQGSAVEGVAKPIDLTPLRLPVLVPAADLAGADARAVVKAELARDPAFRIDLFARDTHRAVELLAAAARSAGVSLATDAVAAERMRRKMPSAWAVYCDALTPDEVAAWLAETAAADDKASLATLHLFAAQAADAKDMRELFGVELSGGRKPAKATGKGVAADTADQVAAALQKGEKPAVLTTYLPAIARSNPALSKELKAFLDRRGERKPGAVSVLLVIRPTSG